MEIQIISGFLGAGKTTFLNQYLSALEGSTVIIENEFGDIGLDGELIRQEDVPVREIVAGCICCSLALDFREGIREISEKFHPDRIMIEPSGVGRLSDIIKACQKARDKDGISLEITKLITIVDLASFEEYADGFGEFYLDQIQRARILFLSHLDEMTAEKRKVQMIRLKKLNPGALLYEGDFRRLGEEELVEMIRMIENYENSSEEMTAPELPADKVFSSIAVLDPGEMTEKDLTYILEVLRRKEYGHVLRAKGIISLKPGGRVRFDYTPSAGRYETYGTKSECTREPLKRDKVIIIGCGLEENRLRELFRNREQ